MPCVCIEQHLIEPATVMNVKCCSSDPRTRAYLAGRRHSCPLPCCCPRRAWSGLLERHRPAAEQLFRADTLSAWGVLSTWLPWRSCTTFQEEDWKAPSICNNACRQTLELASPPEVLH